MTKKNKERLIWFKEEIIPLSDAKINVLAPTSQFGANVFEGLRGYWNADDNQLYIFKLEEHVNRLIQSLRLIRFEEKYTKNELKKFVIDIVKANAFKEDIAIRQTIFIDGFGSWFSTEPTEMFIAPIKKSRMPKQNVACCVSSWERINDNSLSPKIKVGANYMNSRAGHLEAIRNGYDFAIFLNNFGKVSESAGACLFIVRGNKLITPPITASILESITRQTIIDLARKELNIEVEERDIDRTELYVCDEAFLCGSAVEILSINSIDKITLSNNETGIITKRIKECYFSIVRGHLKGYEKYLTPVY